MSDFSYSVRLLAGTSGSIPELINSRRPGVMINSRRGAHSPRILLFTGGNGPAAGRPES